MFRIIEEKDKSEYFDMSCDFYSSGAAAHPITDERREKFWTEIINNQSLKGFIFEEDGQIAGYALAVLYPSQEFGGNVLWIDELYVKPQQRGKGLAKKFLEFAESCKGAVLLRLEVEPDNQKALSLYEKFGFKPLKYLQLTKTIGKD